MLEILENQYVIAILAILVLVYSSLASIQLHPFVRDLFKNDIFRVLYLTLLVVYSHKIMNSTIAPHVAFIVALMFVMTMYFLNIEERNENFRFFEAFYKNMIDNKNAKTEEEQEQE